ncbi:DASH complex subunit Dad2-domain-containing protein [Rhizoctonia solani]|nr:DASH complex subunit Dad2-domain-containing protein [Rhizoctonia solani]
MNRMSSLGQPRQSTIASGQGSSVAQQRYIDKKAEYEGVSALNAASELMVQQLEDIASRTDLMADGGVAIGSVLANWPNVWRIIGLAASAGQGHSQDSDGVHVDEAETVPRLVRIEVNNSETTPASDS